MALYRKWRPQEFDEVKGQDQIVTALRNQVEYNRIGHAYLFCGTRGTGKTTMAKIFARAVNCEHPVNGNPCGKCEMCKRIMAGTSMNVIEMDAASNNGVESIRQIRDEVMYPPTEGKYKVYIIDEAHMITQAAFNALLKTLEEPPSYVIFILATTEANVIPITILSRCQRYDFKRISINTIASRLDYLMKEEEIEVSEPALRYIARIADGSMRDALSILDQCISFYLGKQVSYDDVLNVLGAVDNSVFSQMLEAVIEGDVHQAVATLDEVIMQGRELTQFVNDFVWYLRNLLIAKTSDDAAQMIGLSTENYNRLVSEAEMLEEEIIYRYIRILSELANKLKGETNKRVMIEVALIKLMKPESERDYESLVNRIDVLEKRIESGNIVVANKSNSSRGQEMAASISAPTEKLSIDIKDMQEMDLYLMANWKKLVSSIDSRKIKNFLEMCEPVIDKQHRVILTFTNENSYVGGLINDEVLEEIKEAIKSELDVEYTFVVDVLENEKFADKYEHFVDRFTEAAEEISENEKEKIE